MRTPTDVRIETTLPRPWEEAHTFHDTLYEWMGRAPWMAISAAAHLLAYFILASIPWNQLLPEPPVEIQATLQQPPEEILAEPEEKLEEEVPEELPEEPVLRDAELEQHAEEETDELERFEGEPDLLASPVDDNAFVDVIGIGGAPSGKWSGRFGRPGRPAGGSATARALEDALSWLKAHQSPDGSWDGDGFDAQCGKIGSSACDGGGHALHDVGLTGLALLAFLGDGNTMDRGEHQEAVRKGVFWLKSQQEETGLIGSAASREFVYDHAIATLAICEAYYFSHSPAIKRVAQEAVHFIHRARNPYGAWRYDVPPSGTSDVSVTGWMVFALVSARDAGLEVDEAALTGALSFIDEVTDHGTGRVGYERYGTPSSRTSANEHFPVEKGEAMTAVGLLCRIFLGQDPRELDILDKHADLLLRTPPVWDPGSFGCDMYYWYYGSYAMFQMGGHHWKRWEASMRTAVLDSQRRDGDERGSWDPVGPWGYVGGRVYSTALMTLCLQVYYRYAEVLGAR